MYKTVSGQKIYKPKQYAKTGKPMIDKKGQNINKKTSIYEVKCENQKIYIGKTTNMNKRMKQHFTGNGSQVTKKFAPVSATKIATCNGYFSDKVEQHFTEKIIKKHGYKNVRGGYYTNSKTLTHETKPSTNQKTNQKTNKNTNQKNSCYRCGRPGHYATSCYAKTHINGYSLKHSLNNNNSSDSDY